MTAQEPFAICQKTRNLLYQTAQRVASRAKATRLRKSFLIFNHPCTSQKLLLISAKATEKIPEREANTLQVFVAFSTSSLARHLDCMLNYTYASENPDNIYYIRRLRRKKTTLVQKPSRRLDIATN